MSGVFGVWKGIFKSKIELFEIINKDNTYLFNLQDLKNNIKIDGELKIDTNNKKTKYNITLTTNTDQNGKKFKLDFNLLFTNKKASSFGKIDTKDYVKENELSDIEKVGLYSKLLEKPFVKTLIQFIK